MRQTELKLQFPTEKLDALRFFIAKKDSNIEHELKDYLDKTYERLVPANVREYVESRLVQEQVPEQQTQEAVPESQQEAQPEQEPQTQPQRQPRTTRRQREQAAAEPSSAPEVPSEAEGPAEQENQGMTMSM